MLFCVCVVVYVCVYILWRLGISLVVVTLLLRLSDGLSRLRPGLSTVLVTLSFLYLV